MRARDTRRLIVAVQVWVIAVCSIGGVTSQAAGAAGHTLAQPAGHRELYQAACAACHCSDGRAVASDIVGFDTPIADFTDCSFANQAVRLVL